MPADNGKTYTRLKIETMENFILVNWLVGLILCLSEYELKLRARGNG
jgi:hypothetical protein